MERDRSAKIIAIVALCVAVAGLSIGFAAFSNDLTIKSNASVTPNPNDFDVNFSSQDGSEVAGTVTGVGTNSATAENATIDNSNSPTITGLKANFTEPGQKVTYSFYELLDAKDSIHNAIFYYEVTPHQKCYFYINNDNNFIVYTLKNSDKNK